MKDNISDIKAEETPELLLQNEKETESSLAGTHVKDYGGDTRRQASVVIFPTIAAFAVTALLLTAESTKSFLATLLSASAGEYALRFTSTAASLQAVFKEAITLSDPSMIYLGLMLLMPLSVIYRPSTSVLLFLHNFVISLGTGIVLLSEASFYGKCAVAIAFSIDAAASISAAVSAVSVGNCIAQKSGESRKLSYFHHILKLIFAHGANVFVRFVLLAVGAFIL